MEAAPAATQVGQPAAGTPRQHAWLKATIEQRIRLAEQLGDEGARTFAKSKGWDSVFDGTARTVMQGPDQVYRGSDGLVHVIEAKGGSGQLGRGYGYSQGSTEWAVESAKRVLRHQGASEAERRGASLVLDAATKGKLEVHVVRTSHVLGEPTAAVLEQSMHCTDEAARIARSAANEAARGASQIADDALRASDDVVRAAGKGGTVLRIAAKVAVPVAVAVDGGLRVRDGLKIERQFENGEITVQEREIAHTKNVAGMAGGWGGALVGAKLGAVGGGAAGSAVAPGPGTAIGGVVGGITGGVAGYIGGEAAAEAAAKWGVDRVYEAGTTIAESVEETWDGTVGAANSAVRGVTHALNWVEGK